MRDLELMYREHAARMIAALTRTLGPANLDLAEASVHDAFVTAMRQWPDRGTPDSPRAWLFTVARNRALDAVRRDGRFADKRTAIAAQLQRPPDALRGAFAWELADDQLRMMFVTCHPALPVESRLALTLRTLCGLANEDIAAALLVRAQTLEKRLVRARKTLRDADIAFDLPGPAALAERTEDVLRVLYLLFSEGYSSHSGVRQIRVELCGEAIRLAGLLADHPPTASPRVHALLALMALQVSRTPARLDARGDLITLADQDRSRWDRASIQRGLEHLAAAATGDELSEYHLEAGIAACHAVAARFADTDWAQIARYYEQLAAINPSPVIRVNQAIALAYAYGPARGLALLAAIQDDPRLRDFGLLPAASGDMLADMGELRRAKQAYRRALSLVGTEPERRLLTQKLAELASG